MNASLNPGNIASKDLIDPSEGLTNHSIHINTLLAALRSSPKESTSIFERFYVHPQAPRVAVYRACIDDLMVRSCIDFAPLCTNRQTINIQIFDSFLSRRSGIEEKRVES